MAETKEKRIGRKDTPLPGEGVPFERTRRITGYLVGTVDRFNNAKRAEERDRIPHQFVQTAEDEPGAAGPCM